MEQVNQHAPHSSIPYHTHTLLLDLWWKHFSKRINGPLSQLKNSEKFEKIFKISMTTFSYICSLVKERMTALSSNLTDLNGYHLCLNDKVAIALRRLTSGDSLKVVGDSFGLNPTTVSQLTWQFVEALEESGILHMQWPSTEAQMKEVKSKFEKLQGLPNCCGAIGTTNILMSLSKVDPTSTEWCDKDGNFSMAVQAIVDPDLRFRVIVGAWPGSMTDSVILRGSTFFEFCEQGTRLNGKMELRNQTELREYIIGDSKYPILPWLLTPYEGDNLSDFHSTFNAKLLTTRMVVEQAFERLKENFKLIGGVMWRPNKNKLPKIILACCLLHNILIDLEDEVQKQRSYSGEHGLGYLNSESSDRDARILRENVALYVCGQLPA